MGVPFEDFDEVQSRTHGHLKHVFPIPNIGNFDGPLAGLRFHKEAENVVYVAEYVIFGDDFSLEGV